jgi:uncharacterized membrane protein
LRQQQPARFAKAEAPACPLHDGTKMMSFALAVPNRLIAWRSELGSVIDHAGIVQFDAENDHIRVHIRLSYFCIHGSEKS